MTFISPKNAASQGAEAIQQIDLHAASSDGRSTASGSDALDSPPQPRRKSDEFSYGDRAYWNERYRKELAPNSTASQHFEWYIGYASSPLRDLLREQIPLAAPILQIGVGTSQLQREMVEDGFQRIVSTDTSIVAVEHMQALHVGIPQLMYCVADCQAMPQFQDGTFSAVLDKGTLDAITCGPDAAHDTHAMVAECYRVLEPGGVCIEISYGCPSRRLPYLTAGGTLNWASVSVSGVRNSSQPEQAAAAGARQQLPPLLGPYDASEAVKLDGVEVDSYYFCYILRKPG